MAEVDLTAIAAASIGTPAVGVGAVYVDVTTKKVASKNDAGLVSDYVDLASAQAVTGVKTLTNPTMATNTNAVPAMTIPAGGVVLAAAAAGAVETDGAVFYKTHNVTDGRGIDAIERWFRLTGTVGPISGIADVFGANSAIGLAANGVYTIEWHVYAIQNTGAATNWTWTITLSGAVTKVSAHYLQSALAGIGTVAAPLMAGNLSFTSTTALPVTGSVVNANQYAVIRAIVEVGATPRDIRLRLASTANSATIQTQSYYRARRVSAGNTGAFTA
jgi:hypothetical protein